MIAVGEVTKELDGGFLVYVPCSNHKEQVRRCKRQVVVEFDDGRIITTAQRRKAYVLIQCIANWWGYTPLEAMKELTKYMFRSVEITLKDDMFSLSNCDRTTARLYITFLIDFCILHDIPCGEPMWKLCEDIPRYVYACLMKKTCAVCGRHAELHHLNRIGMGRNRKEVPQIGMHVLPLCRKHHNEAHEGESDFLKRYLLEPVRLTYEAAEIYRLTKKAKREASPDDKKVKQNWKIGRSDDGCIQSKQD